MKDDVRSELEKMLPEKEDESICNCPEPNRECLCYSKALNYNQALIASATKLASLVVGVEEILKEIREANKSYDTICGQWQENNPKPFPLYTHFAEALQSKFLILEKKK